LRRSNALVLLLFTLSGVSALVYQIVWIRMLSHLLGGTTYAISLVLAAFMGGLALGSRFYGVRADATARPLRLYARLEFGIAALGLLASALILLATPVYVGLSHLLPSGALGILRGILALLLLLPPTFLMGGTLPVLSRYVVRSHRRLGRDLGWLYAVNTFGAVLGCLLAGTVLVATFGVLVSIVLAVLLNALIGVMVLGVDRSQPSQVPGMAAEPLHAGGASVRQKSKQAAQAPTPEAPEIGLQTLALLFAATGFAALGYEIYWTRALQFFLGNSTYAYSAMLTTFLLGLSLGGWLGGRCASAVAAPSRLLAWVQLSVGITAILSVLLIWGWLPQLHAQQFLSAPTISWPSYLLRRFLVAGAIMAPATILIGMTFPIVSQIGIGSLAHLSRGVGFLSYSNTLGAILGSLVGGFLLLPLLGAKGALLTTGLMNVAIGMIVLWVSRRRRSLELGVAGLVGLAILLLVVIARGAGGSFLANTQAATDLVLFDRQDHAADTRVYQKPNGELHMSVDGHHIGGTEMTLLRKEKILAHLPMALMPQAEKTLSVGLGSGTTLATFALYPQLQRLDCVEIVPGVVQGARFFGDGHGNVLDDPRVDVVVGDGVQFLLTTQERYDIIASDSKLNPAYVGNAPLLSRDYYELCAQRLDENGVMIQWLESHVPTSAVQSIARGFVQAFPHAGLFWYDPYNLLLVGSHQPLRLDVEAAAQLARTEAVARDLQSLQLENPQVFAGLFVAGDDRLAEAIGDGTINTWMFPRLEFTLLRDYRSRETFQHAEDNLRWMLRSQDTGALQVLGAEARTVDLFRRSSTDIMKAFAVGGGMLRLELGLEDLERARAINPQDRRAGLWIDLVTAMQEGLEQAAARGQLHNADDLVRLGLARADAGKDAEAMVYFDRALEQLPNDANIQYNRLVSLRRLQRTDEFRTSLETFRQMFPRDARGLSMQGRLHASDGDFEKALRAFEEAERLSPANAVFVNNVATTLARLERNGEAGERFAQVVELDADFPDAAYFAAASFSKAGRTAEAAQWMRYCLDHGLAQRHQFETQDFFANLRASDDWVR